MLDLVKSSSLLFALLNPFLVVLYLLDLIQKLDRTLFRRVLVRAGLISGTVFSAFAILGDIVFSDLMGVEFASFQIFGGIVFLLIGLQFVFRGPTAIEILRGESEHLAGAIAMPVMIGPGTVSASVLIGERHNATTACLVVLATVALCVLIILLLKELHDFIRPRREKLVERYIEIVGRIMAFYVGTVAVEMIMRGVQKWAVKL